MLPAFGIEGLRALISEQRDGGAVAAGGQDAADSGDGDAGNFFGDAGGGWGGEKQFVVFSAVKGLVEGCAGMDGDQRGIDFGGHAGFLAEVGEVGREAVAEVHGRGGQRMPDQPEALGDAGLRVKMWR